MIKALCLPLWLFAFYLYVWHPSTTHLVDFSVYWEAGQRVARGESIYALNYEVLTHTGETFRPPFSYPPVLAAGVSLFSSLEKSTAQWLWCLAGWLAALASAYLLARILWRLKCGEFQKLLLGCSFGLVCFEPVYWGIRMGQVDIFILALLAGATYAFIGASQRSAGFLVSLAAAIKMSPALVLLPLIRKGWKECMFGVGITLAICAALVGISGVLLSDLQLFFTNFTNLAAGKVDAEFITNFAIYRPVLGLLGISDNGFAGWIVKVMLLVVCVVLSLRLRLNSEPQRLSAVGFVVCWMIALPPTVHFQHLTWGLIPLIAIASHVRDMRGAFWAAAVYFALDQSNLIMYSVLDKLPAATPAAQLFPACVLTFAGFWLWRLNRATNAGLV